MLPEIKRGSRMPGKQLSRWTMAWFASAVLFLIAALGLMVAGAAGPAHWDNGRALAVVHLFALGWLGQMMLGALLQFAPVLVARPLALQALALPALLMSTLGVLLLAAGFLALDGWEGGILLLEAGPVLLAGAFVCGGAMLGGTMIAVGGWRGSEARAVLAGLAGLALVWISGAGMVLDLTGNGPGQLIEALPLHVAAGVGGWLGLAAFGVSYKLFAMFLLAPEGDSTPRRAGFALALVALSLVLGGLTAVLTALSARLAVVGVVIAALAAALLYLADIRRLWTTRRRPQPEVNMQMSRAALAFLALVCGLLPFAAAWGGRWAEAAVFAALVGWLSTLTLAQMIKIVSFLTWIQCFAPRIGKAKVPVVQDLTNAGATRRWLWLWTLGALCGTMALLAETPLLFRLACLALLAAAIGLAAEAVAIRRLSHLSPDARPARVPVILPPPAERRPRNDPMQA